MKAGKRKALFVESQARDVRRHRRRHSAYPSWCRISLVRRSLLEQLRSELAAERRQTQERQQLQAEMVHIQ